MDANDPTSNEIVDNLSPEPTSGLCFVGGSPTGS